MNYLAVSSIVIPLIVVVFIVIYLFFLKNRRQKEQQLDEQLTDILSLQRNLQQQIASFNQQLQSSSTIVKAQQQQLQAFEEEINLKLDTLFSNLEHIESKVQLIESETPENKLYSRAKKMIEMGADIEEVISECEISRAEAQLLFSLNIK